MTDNKQTLNDLNLPTMSLIEKFCNTPEEVKIFFAEMLSVYENNPTPENLQLIAEKIKSRESREEKQAWLKVIRGEFEGKEYLVFAGTTSIGNNGKNTIVLFKDKLVGPHHCYIKLEGSKYVLYDCGTPMGTVVNGRRTASLHAG